MLTQNTTWRNAALAIAQLREAQKLSLRGLGELKETRVQSLIRPAGLFSQKARAIRRFLRWLDEAHSGSLERMFATPAEELRAQLLDLKGLGPETVDAILLYAGRQAFFVADAYTLRILERHGMLAEDATYVEAQNYIHRHLKRDSELYNEFHALLAEVGKVYGRRSQPDCERCPLKVFLPAAGPTGTKPAGSCRHRPA
ncbi:MAG TPA: endonuclease III domain-containing protein [Terriglobia bacterium]